MRSYSARSENLNIYQITFFVDFLVNVFAEHKKLGRFFGNAHLFFVQLD